MSAPSPIIDPIRLASRQLVRELGFMGGPFAGTVLPPSAVHALIEIEASQGITAQELAVLLRLEKSSVSRMLRKLVSSGDVLETPSKLDSRRKHLTLSTAGNRRVAAIHDFARSQVARALDRLHPGDEQVVFDGLRLYAKALAAEEQYPQPPQIKIVSGYRTGLIASITQMHALYYARTSGFGQQFESVVASGLAEFCNRLDRQVNAIWLALRGDEVVGSIAIDGEDMGSGIAHLRWFIVDDSIRGGGIGKTLLASALSFVDERGFSETHLWTFSGLDAARRLYEANGFSIIEERPGNQWGSKVMEQRFVRKRPAHEP
jgi:DNA-binding MarR family transcriptional regulator/GNAT superfamily N-acetyltransferase